MRRAAVVEAIAVGVLGLSILGGAMGIYYYTLAPPTNDPSTTTSSSQASTGTATISLSEPGPAGGSCKTNAQGQCIVPEGVWADYLGYIPTGYVPASPYPSHPDYPCPSGMDAEQCATFQRTCGNGVCDPNETCATCPIDCGFTGGPGLIAPPVPACNPYTGRPAAPGASATEPISVCQITTMG
jgi:hypothetical protein